MKLAIRKVRKVRGEDAARPWRVQYGGIDKHFYSFSDALFFVQVWLRVNYTPIA